MKHKVLYIKKKPETPGYYHVEGYQDQSTWAKVKGGIKMHTNFWTPCINANPVKPRKPV